MTEGMANKDFLALFDESGLDPKKTVVRCATQEEANIFVEYLYYKNVWPWESVRRLSERWRDYACATCYHLSKPSWCYEEYYRDHYPEYDIVDFCDIYLPSRTTKLDTISYSYAELFS